MYAHLTRHASRLSDQCQFTPHVAVPPGRSHPSRVMASMLYQSMKSLVRSTRFRTFDAVQRPSTSVIASNHTIRMTRSVLFRTSVR